jgi:phosphoglycerate-specific signal transduction histidine kinase
MHPRVPAKDEGVLVSVIEMGRNNVEQAGRTGETGSAINDAASRLLHEISQPLAAASNYLYAARRLLGAQGEKIAPNVDEALDKASVQMLKAAELIAERRAASREAQN